MVSRTLKAGLVVTVDDKDAWLLDAYRWWTTSFNGVTHYVFAEVDGRKIGLHRLLMQPAAGQWVDHRDGNPLNNTRGNLRVCTPSQNGWNRGKNRNNRSGFKGVYLYKRLGRFRARVVIARKDHDFGFYDAPEEAALAVNEGMKRLHGEFARFNEVEGEAPRRLRRGNTTGFRGVAPQGARFRAQIGWEGRMVHLGIFEEAEEAARAYDAKAKELLGDRAKLNFPG